MTHLERKTPSILSRAILVTLVALPSARPDAGGAAPFSPELTTLAAASDLVVLARVVQVRGKQQGEATVREVTLEAVETFLGISREKITLELADEGARAPREKAPPPPALAPGTEVVAFLARTTGGKLILAGGGSRGFSTVKRDPSGDRVLEGGAADGLPLSALAALGDGRATGAGSEGPGGAASGIEGEARIGPTRPSHRIGGPPDVAPYETALVIEAAATGEEVARVTTGPDGRFHITLPAGDYVVRPAAPGKLLPRAEPIPVEVVSGRFTHVTVNFDSGMR